MKKYSSYYDAVLDDPLFAAEGINIDNTKLALKAYESLVPQLEILDTTTEGKNFFSNHPLIHTLHPFRFIGSFLGAESARRKFLANPSRNALDTLNEAHLKTVNALDKDLDAFRSAVETLQEISLRNNPKAYMYKFYRRAVPFMLFIDNIKIMEKNAKTIRKEILIRSKLPLKSGYHRKRLDTISKPLSSVQIQGPDKFIDLVTKNWAYKYFVEQRFGKLKIETWGPFSLKVTNFDSKPTTHSFILLLAKDRTNTYRFLLAILTDQFHFLELSKQKYTFYIDRFIYEPLVKLGINHWYQPATTFYFSPDLTFYPELATKTDLKRRPKLNKNYLINQKSSMLDLFLWTGYFQTLEFQTYLLSRIKAGLKPASKHFLLIARNYQSLYFLPFNKSVWRINKHPNFLGDYINDDVGYINQSNLPKNLSAAYLKKVFEGGKIRAKALDDFITNS